ncbi:hypothetical protein [Nocardia farcinica]|uniref:hypothetical protein n=1 Tax=Nocardia farcinica TaxID=37329 RepID=UPI00245830DD|nr:hypothetical protein [Nocardia farcinica]
MTTAAVDNGMTPIEARCDAEGGLTVATLKELRDCIGRSKLGKWVLGEIAEALDEHRLGYFPTGVLVPETNPEPRQWQEVWVYRKDNSPLARVVDTILDPGRPELVRATLASVRIDDEAGLTAEQKIERIRAIVG